MLEKFRTRLYRILRWSEHYTKTDMIYAAKGGSWLMVGNGVATGLGFLLTIGFANLIPKEVFGTYKYILSVAAIIGIFSVSGGIGTAIKRAVAQGYSGSLQVGFWQSLLWGSAMTIVGIIAAGYYFLNDNFILGTSLLFVGALLPLAKSGSLFNNFLVGKKDFRTKTIYDIGKSAFTIGTLLITIYLTNNPVVIVFAYFASQAATSLFFYFRVLKTYQPDRENKVDVFNYGAHLSAMAALRKVANQLDKILVFSQLGAAPLAIYSFAREPINVLRRPSNIIETLIFPKLSERTIPELKRILPRKIAIAFLLFAAIALAYILAAPYLFQYVLPAYTDSVVYSQVLAITLIFVPSLFFQQALTAHMKKKQLYIVHTLVPSLKIILLLVLLPLYGIWGVIISLFGARAFGFFLHLFLFMRLKE